MKPIRLTVRSHPRADVPVDVGPERWLTAVVRSSVAEGRDGVVGIVLRERAIDLVDLASATSGGARAGWLLAGLTSTSTLAGGRAEAVGVLGRRKQRRAAGTIDLAFVFLEWTDCRWWSWESVIDGRALVDAPVVRSAVDGDPLPGGIGRWWSAARRDGLRVELEPAMFAGDTSAVH